MWVQSNIGASTNNPHPDFPIFEKIEQQAPQFALQSARDGDRSAIDDLLAETPDRYNKIKDKVEEMIIDPELEIQLKDVVNYLPWEFNYFKYRSFGFRK